MSTTDDAPIRIVDARDDATAAAVLRSLRESLSPRGDLVSDRGRELTRRVFGGPLSPIEVVQKILDDVQTRGTEALLHYTAELDGKTLDFQSLRVPAAELAAAHAAADTDFIAVIDRIASNIRTFQTAIRHTDVTIQPSAGVTLTQRYQPLRRVGVCVPGGAAAYPSTVLMTVVPAQVAGVDEICVVAPPTEFGAYNRDMLAVCQHLGVTEVYRCGGAQAIAAMAYGCDAIAAVDKIVGPGNLFVALAKKMVYGTVDIDSFAGPSEVIVIADDTARPDWVAADLIAQAEHSPGSSLLVTWHKPLIDAVADQLNRQLATAVRGDLAAAALKQFGALMLVRDADHACEVTDAFAPEHLQIETEDPAALMAKLRNCGAAFLGHHTPVALGDYAAGPSHVLPTGGTCRWAAGLNVNSFLRSGSVTTFDDAALRAIGPDVIALAEKEGLEGHAQSVRIRTTHP